MERFKLSRLKVFAGLVALAFAVTLAVIVGNRLSEEALAVLAGAACGVGAAIPTSLLIMAVSDQRQQRAAATKSPVPEMVTPTWSVEMPSLGFPQLPEVRGDRRAAIIAVAETLRDRPVRDSLLWDEMRGDWDASG